MADPRAIHEFLTGEVEATTLILGDFVDLDAQSGYTTYKASVSDIGEVILEDIEYTQDLQTVNKTIVGAINENKSVIGYSYDEYDPTTAYAKDDLCIYNNSLYKALQATTGNLPTNTTYWEETSIATALSGKADNSDLGITTLSANDLFASGHYIDSFIAYKIGKIVFVQYISSSTMSYGNATDDYLAYFKSNTPYKPVNSVRYCFTTTRDSTIYRGECSSTGLFCRSFPQQGTFGQWAMSFFYEIA